MSTLLTSSRSVALAERDHAHDLATGVRVRGTVFAVVAAYAQAKVRTADGEQYSITRRTAGVPFDEIGEGQNVELEVSSGAFPRVLSVRIVA